MSEQAPEQKDENSQLVVADSSPATPQADVATTPPAENAGAPKPENKVPQGRFNEVIQERNTEREARERLEARIRELETVRAESAPKRKSVADLEVERLVSKLNMEESAAREIVATYQNLNQAQLNERAIAESRYQAEAWATQKAKNDPVYVDIEPELDRSFSALKPEMQQFVAQNADALEMFYESVKAKHVGSKSKESYAKGADDALKNKLAKQAVSSVPGSSSSVGKTELSRKSLAAMSTAEYMKRLPEINEAVRNGTLK